MNNKFELTEKERLSYVIQLEILEKLYPEDTIYTELKKALSYGFMYHYGDLIDTFLNRDELSVNDCKLVLNILDMYRTLIFSAQHYKWKDMSTVRFLGFDCNDKVEVKMYSYARYFMEDLDRYNEIKELSNGDYNSHMQMLPKYKRMLEEFDKISKIDGYYISEKNIKRILNIK